MSSNVRHLVSNCHFVFQGWTQLPLTCAALSIPITSIRRCCKLSNLLTFLCDILSLATVFYSECRNLPIMSCSEVKRDPIFLIRETTNYFLMDTIRYSHKPKQIYSEVAPNIAVMASCGCFLLSFVRQFKFWRVGSWNMQKPIFQPYIWLDK